MTRRKQRLERIWMNAHRRRWRLANRRWSKRFGVLFDEQVARLEEAHLFYVESLYYGGPP